MFGRRFFRLFGSIRLQHAAADQLQQLILVGHSDIVVTYEDKLLELIRSGALQTDASEKPEGSPAEHAA